MKRHPSPSTLVALIALVVALGGTAVAATHLIDGAKLKPGSVTGSKLKKDTLTGKQIKESTLATVPSAKRANTATAATNASHATTAGNASALGGIGAGQFVRGGGQTFATGFMQSPSTVDTPVYTIPGVGGLSMECSSNGSTSFTLLNGTGQTVLRTEAGNTFISGSGSSSESGGRTVTPDGTLLSNVPITTGQYNVVLAWPASSPSHGSQLTLGSYRDGGTGKCVLTVAGFVR